MKRLRGLHEVCSPSKTGPYVGSMLNWVEGNGCGGVETAQPAADLQTVRLVLAIQGTPIGPKKRTWKPLVAGLQTNWCQQLSGYAKLLKVERFFNISRPYVPCRRLGSLFDLGSLFNLLDPILSDRLSPTC